MSLSVISKASHIALGFEFIGSAHAETHLVRCVNANHLLCIYFKSCPFCLIGAPIFTQYVPQWRFVFYSVFKHGRIVFARICLSRVAQLYVGSMATCLQLLVHNSTFVLGVCSRLKKDSLTTMSAEDLKT